MATYARPAPSDLWAKEALRLKVLHLSHRATTASLALPGMDGVKVYDSSCTKWGSVVASGRNGSYCSNRTSR